MAHSALIFYITFVGLSDSAILNGKMGYATDLWTSSLTAFTALVVTVNLNLILRMRYITYMHALSFVIVSFGFYLAFMWFTNFVDFGWMQYSVEEAHKSLNFYMIIALTVGICFSLDFAYECYLVLIKTSPTSYLRLLVNKGFTIDSKKNKEQFQILS